MPSDAPNPDTIRAHLMAIRDEEVRDYPASHEMSPIYKHAVAALALLDNAKIEIPVYVGNPETGEFEPYPCRLVPDPASAP